MDEFHLLTKESIMNAEIPSPFLFFDFMDENGKKQPLIFTEPVEVIEARQIDEIRPALERVQQANKNGYYAAGYLSYEAAPAFDHAFTVKKGYKLPLLWLGIFSAPHQNLAAPSFHPNGYQFAPWTVVEAEKDYPKKIASIKDAIAHGETYQINYTTRLHTHFKGDDFAYFKSLRSAQQGNYAAYLNLGRYRILSASPELFFTVKERLITTRPMKGTAKRGKWAEDDLAQEKWLYHSEKNQAENVMIVDLLRNDLGRVAKMGSVHVTSLFDIERYPTVLQMTSSVEATLHEGTTLSDVFTALFPCGSITGAPKVETMRIISELENTPREVYCGTIGFTRPNGNAVFSVAIRTLSIDAQTGIAEYGTGGGITWDSTAKDEYAEAIAKAALLTTSQPDFALLETLKLENLTYVLLDKHLERLVKSAGYFQIPLPLKAVQTALQDHTRKHPHGPRRVRLLVNQEGNIQLESFPLESQIPREIPFLVKIAESPIDQENRFLYHKTTYREMYNVHRGTKPEDVFDVLLWNQNQEITEFTVGNIVVEIAGKKLTPALSCGLLPGTLRAHLLETGQIEEAILTLSDLEKADNIWFINSVRGWIPVQMVDSKIKKESL
jgi:para-aminobenzoate synthetase / 4-amino-4-deoxychorismate lyase